MIRCVGSGGRRTVPVVIVDSNAIAQPRDQRGVCGRCDVDSLYAGSICAQQVWRGGVWGGEGGGGGGE